MKKLLFLLALLALPVAAQQRTDTGAAWVHTAITPSDTVYLTTNGQLNGARSCRAVYVRTAGTITIEDSVGTLITYTVVDNTLIPFSPTRVRSTGTTATNIVCWMN